MAIASMQWLWPDFGLSWQFSSEFLAESHAKKQYILLKYHEYHFHLHFA